MILQNIFNGNETEIANGSHVYVKAENYGVFVDWTKLTPATQEALSEIDIQAEELRSKSLKLLKEQYPTSCAVHEIGEPMMG